MKNCILFVRWKWHRRMVSLVSRMTMGAVPLQRVVTIPLRGRPQTPPRLWSKWVEPGPMTTLLWWRAISTTKKLRSSQMDIQRISTRQNHLLNQQFQWRDRLMTRSHNHLPISHQMQRIASRSPIVNFLQLSLLPLNQMTRSLLPPTQSWVWRGEKAVELRDNLDQRNSLLQQSWRIGSLPTHRMAGSWSMTSWLDAGRLRRCTRVWTPRLEWLWLGVSSRSVY